ncbi:B12-binding domain-containing radical SAM protein [Acidobacteriota bacterium]
MPSTRNILLINPWIYDFTAYDFWIKPLGLLYMASILKKHTNFRLSFIDCLDRHHPLLSKAYKTKPDGRGSFPKEEVTKPQVLSRVPRKYSRYGIPLPIFSNELDRIPQPDLVLLTCTMTYWYPGVQIVIELIRKKFGQVPVILGGIYATLMTHHAKNSSGADIILEGPGEKKILPLIREVLGDKSCSPYQFEALDEIPRPAFNLLRNKSTLPLLTSRGCPFRCSFCASSLLFENFEQRKSASVFSELNNNFRLHKARNIALYDDALLLNKEHHILPILREIIRKKLPLVFHTPNGLHVKAINSELAVLLKKANFQTLFLSQESFDEKVIEESCSKVSSKDLEKALANLEKAGYNRKKINVYLIMGLPEQRISGIKESILQVQRLGAQPRLTFFSPLPGTKDWKKIVEKGHMDRETDPLLQNKLTFPYTWGDFSPDNFESLKNLLSLRKS